MSCHRERHSQLRSPPHSRSVTPATLITHPPTSRSIDTLSFPIFTTFLVMTSFLLLLLLLALTQLLCPVLSSSTGSLCILMYSLPGTVDYPFSVAYNLQLTYDPTPVTISNHTYITLFAANGTRTYTNRFGVSTSTTAQLEVESYLAGFAGGPFGVSDLSLQPVVQLAGVGALISIYAVQLLNVYGSLTESGFGASSHSGIYTSAVIDPNAQAYRCSIPGFTNTTIAASNVNALTVRYSECQAPITFTNGLRAPLQPSASNSALLYNYGYTISDGETYSVTTNFTLTMSSEFAVSQDSLGNPYQTVIGIVGIRSYTNLTSGVVTTQNVTRLAPDSFPTVGHGFPHATNNTFYPYALLGSAPGVYSIHTAPFLDGGGIVYMTSSTGVVQVLLVPVLTGGIVTGSVMNEQVFPNSYTMGSLPTPVLSLQRQSLALL